MIYLCPFPSLSSFIFPSLRRALPASVSILTCVSLSDSSINVALFVQFFLVAASSSSHFLFILSPFSHSPLHWLIPILLLIYQLQSQFYFVSFLVKPCLVPSKCSFQSFDQFLYENMLLGCLC